MSKEREKAELGAAALRGFCESWGDNVHARILLEVLFRGLMNEEALFISGEPQQTGDQTCDNPTGGISGHLKDNGSDSTQSSPIVGAEDPANYP